MTRRILVAGELNADLILSGLPSLPVYGRELLGSGFAMVLGSSSAITAARLAKLGAEYPGYGVDFVGQAGTDDIGRFVVAKLREYGVNTDAVQTVDTPTGVTIALTYPHDRALLTYPGTIATFDGAGITAEMLSGYSHLHVGSFFLQTALQPHLARLFEMARQVGVTTSLDVGWDPSETWMANQYLAGVLKQTDYFMPNEDETAALAPTPEDLKRLVAGMLIIKQGKRGATAYLTDKTAVSGRAFSIEPVDTTGAGDAFNAGLIYALRIQQQPLDIALRFAAACGAQATQHVGGATAAPSENEVQHWMTERKTR